MSNQPVGGTPRKGTAGGTPRGAPAPSPAPTSRESAGGTPRRSYETPEPTITEGRSDYWTRERVQGLYDYAHAQPSIFSEDALALVDAAQGWYTSGQTAMDAQLAGYLDLLGDFEPTPIETPEIAAPTAQPPGTISFPTGPNSTPASPFPNMFAVPPVEPTVYGYTPAQWDTLEPWQKFSARVFSTGATGGAATGLVTGIQGGVPGMIAGSVLGTTIGALSDRFPAFQKVLEAFNVGAVGVKRTLGTMALINRGVENSLIEKMEPETARLWMGEDATQRDTSMTAADVLSNLEDAWYAADLVYMAGSEDMAADLPMMLKEFITTGEISDAPRTLAAWDFGTTTERQLTLDQIGPAAMQELFERLDADPNANLEELIDEYEARFGFQGQMRNMAGEMLLDPLNIIGGVAAKGIAGIGKALGASSDFAKAFGDAAGPVQGARRYKALSSTKDFGEWSNLPRFEKWLSGAYTSEGAPTLTAIREYGNPISRTFGYLTGATPEARAKEFVSVLSQNAALVADRSGMTLNDYIKHIELISKNNLKAAGELGRRSFGGAEMTAAVPALRSILPDLRTIAAEYDANAAPRNLLTKAAKAMGTDEASLVKKLREGKRQSILARLAASSDETLKTMTPAQLDDLAGAFKKPGSVWNEQMAIGQAYAAIVEGAAKWSADYYRIKPDAYPVRLTNLVKNLQGLAMLDLSPMYAAQNIVDNTLKLSREGVLGFLTPGSAQRYIDDLYGEGLAPTRISEGMINDILAGDDAIAQAKRTKKGGVLGGLDDAVSGVRRKIGVASKFSSGAESRQRGMAYATGLQKAMADLWQPGKGFQRMSAELERALGRDTAQWVYGKITGNTSSQKIIDAIFTDTPARTADDALHEAAASLGIPESQVRQALDTLGVTDFLREHLPPNATPDQVRGAFDDLNLAAQRKFDEWHRSQVQARAERAANTTEVEGGLGAMRVIDDINTGFFEQRVYDFDAWQRIHELRGVIGNEAYGRAVRRQFDLDQRTYRRLNENARAEYGAVMRALGMDNEFGRGLGNVLIEIDEAWAGFYDLRKTELQAAFDEVKRRKLGFAEGKEIFAAARKRIDEAYEATKGRVLEQTMRRDTLLIEAIGSFYGDAARTAADAWLSGARSVQAELYDGMLAFRRSIADLPIERKDAAWRKFLDETHRPKLAQMLAANLEGSRTVYVEAQRANRTANVPAAPTQPRPNIPADRWLQEARRDLLKQNTGLDEAARARVDEARRIAAEFGIASADANGKLVSGFDKRLLATVKKYGGEEYAAVQDIDPDVLRRALEKRAAEKAATKYNIPEGQTSGVSSNQLAAIANQLPEEYMSRYTSVGLRTQQGTFGQGVGDVMAHRSSVWDDGTQTDELLDGVSAIDIDVAGGWINDKNTGYGGDTVLVLGSDNAFAGNDVGEIIMTEPEILEIIPVKIRTAPPPSQFDASLLNARMAIFDKYAAELNKLGIDNATNWETLPADVRKLANEIIDRRIEEINRFDAATQPARAAAFPEPDPAEVERLAWQVEDERLLAATRDWGTPEQRTAWAEGVRERIAPDPIGIAPPGTVAGNSPEPIYDILTQGWNDGVVPILDAMQTRLLDPASRAKGLAGAAPQAAKELRRYLERVSGELAETKLAATKFAEVSVDTAMLNYNRRYGIDNILQAAMPYQFWYGRSAVNWALTAIDRPAWFANWMRIRKMQEELATPTEGFPKRLAGKMQIHAPWLPDQFGDTIYFDPWHTVFGFEGMAAQVLRPLFRDMNNRESRAQYILQEQAYNGEISEQQAADALRARSGALWDAAYAQADAEVKAEIESPVDLVSTMLAPSVPLAWALEAMGLKQSRNGTPIEQIGQWPIFQTIQNITAGITPGGFNAPEYVLKALGAAETNERGFLWDYYVQRELANMAATGADVEAVKLAMIEKQGPLWEQAVSTVGKQNAARSFSSLLWLDFFPEGEARQRQLSEAFSKAADAGQIGAFLDANPEYEAQLLKNRWDDPEERMRGFLRSSIWEAYNNLGDLEKRDVRDQLGAEFVGNFLSKETRSYDSISTEMYAQWARALNGVVPQNAPETPAMALELPQAGVGALYEQYYNLPGNAAAGVYYDLPKANRDAFLAAHPEIYTYWDTQNRILAEHPELIPYVIGEKNNLYGAPEAVQMEVIQYRALKSTYFPAIERTQSMYYDLPKSQRAAFLRQHPELTAYWDWNDSAVADLSAQAFYYVKGESGIEKLRQGKDYQPEYRVDYDAFSREVTLAISAHALTNAPIGGGADRELRRMYERERPPLSYEQWLEKVFDAFDWTK